MVYSFPHRRQHDQHPTGVGVPNLVPLSGPGTPRPGPSSYSYSFGLLGRRLTGHNVWPVWGPHPSHGHLKGWSQRVSHSVYFGAGTHP
ncbi:hypothetical protein AG1IA_02259 [Rhizoctonia solani AG-1 IA]|uniref:Uncharacterized protein n=1 Tax=Thanatephorus cucumeris (strain AG1-IA) TaxID=983506 RepID=L8X0G8_THACA|nr:hypothetical protein AG1IA_02259 [Rhizoctonia solani AG-1 IA]